MLPEIVKNVKTTLFGYLVQRCAILDLELRPIPFARELVIPKLARSDWWDDLCHHVLQNDEKVIS